MKEEEKDFFERCFGIVAGLEVQNEAQAIAKEVVLDEIENLQCQLKAKEEAEKEFKEWIANEQFRLARSVSHSYKDSLNKTHLVNEDIFDELSEVLDKYKEILSKGENK